jgi:type III pantothenate kinase
VRVLAIDAGNTHVKWGWHDGSRWQVIGKESCRRFLADGESESAKMLSDLGAQSDRAMVCCVAGPEVRETLASRLSVSDVRWVAPQPRAYGVTNGYDAPEQLGADRWVNLVAARHLFRDRDRIVASAGTALTVDALQADGRHLGGIIVPGVALQRDALAAGTAGVRAAAGKRDVFPRNTTDAVHTGALVAMAGATERMKLSLEARCGRGVLTVLTGGGAAELAPLLESPVSHVERLLFEGLLWIAENPN